MTLNHHILVVDDEKNAREGLKWILDSKYSVSAASDARQALAHLAERPTDLVVTDLKMPGMDGMELLRRIKDDDPSIEVIVITAHGSEDLAVEAMETGAFTYQTKPIHPDELKLKIASALERRGLTSENERLHRAVEERFGFQNIIGRSPAMEAVFQIVRQVAPTRANVLIQGETGVGKELIAKAIHFNSPRARRPFIPVNCGALAAGLLESELFGHEKGAFTGAVQSRIGRFEAADRGTIFLDEVSETSPEFQVKLLRVLQEQTFERVGGASPIGVDVRVLAATNRDLEALMEGKFRDDLYYRLNVVKIVLPPLRERPEDIPLLATAFLREFNELYDKKDLRFSPKTLARLQTHDWPGNVRQLRNVIENLVVLSTTREIGPRGLPDSIRQGEAARGVVSLPIGSTLADAERELIHATLLQHKGNRAKTARVLGIGRKTLYRKLEQYEIE